MDFTLDSPTPDSTYGLGQKLGHSLRGDETILLEGDLGAGKTLFTKGVAQSLGIDPTEIVSPTFSLMNFHTIPRSGENGDRIPVSSHTFIHVDCYRLGEAVHEPDSGSGVLLSLPELDGWISKAIIAVEWAQYLQVGYSRLPGAIRVAFEVLSGSLRRIHFRGVSGSFDPGKDAD